MSTKRYYGDNGELIRYEMKTRGARYYKSQVRDMIIRTVIVLGVGFALLAVALISY